MFNQVIVGAIVFTVLGIIGGGFLWMIFLDWRELKQQPPVELPEWLQDLTHEQLRELLQAKQHMSQAELHAMADNMRALNVVRPGSSLVEPRALPFQYWRTGGGVMPLDPQDKQRLVDAYDDHMSAIKAFESHRPSGGPTEANEQRYFTTEAKLDRIAEEIGVTPQDYDELEQSIEREEGWSIG